MSVLKLNDDEKIFSSRVEDLIRRCESKCVSQFTSFLSDREIEIAKEVIVRLGYSDYAIFFGGYDDAERKILGIFPEYAFSSGDDLKGEFPIRVLLVKCSGFREHSHRDFLGSALGLGIERSVIGDIVPLEKGYSAYMFVHDRIASFVCDNLSLVGRDGVKVSVCHNFDSASVKRNLVDIPITVASLRIDAVISEILNLSREKSTLLIHSQAVSINHRIVEDKSEEVKHGDTISIKGHGKFILSEIGGLNRKGRIRVIIQKYV